MQARLQGAAHAPAVLAAVALGAAAATLVFPAWDARLPGGAIAWQAGAFALALYAAVRALRHAENRWVRLLAAAGLCIALLWTIGVAILFWPVWPR